MLTRAYTSLKALWRKLEAISIRLLHERTIPVLAVLLAGAAFTMVWHVSTLQSNLLESTALQNAKLYSKALTEFRTLYTSEVVNTVHALGIEVTHDYKAKNGAIPLPATLSMMLGDSIGS